MEKCSGAYNETGVEKHQSKCGQQIRGMKRNNQGTENEARSRGYNYTEAKTTEHVLVVNAKQKRRL
eukprot:7919841-Pyramimonas_sp.AAC.1